LAWRCNLTLTRHGLSSTHLFRHILSISILSDTPHRSTLPFSTHRLDTDTRWDLTTFAMETTLKPSITSPISSQVLGPGLIVQPSCFRHCCLILARRCNPTFTRRGLSSTHLFHHILSISIVSDRHSPSFDFAVFNSATRRRYQPGSDDFYDGDDPQTFYPIPSFESNSLAWPRRSTFLLSAPLPDFGAVLQSDIYSPWIGFNSFIPSYSIDLCSLRHSPSFDLPFSTHRLDGDTPAGI
jgi:hypothetical protein